MVKSYLAPAKINLRLNVLGKRPDGYHDLSMIMQCVSLYDRVEICLKEGAGVDVSCPGVDVPPGAENIAARAVRALLSRAGSQQGVAVTIEKHIPVAAGLGGGSSDAAAVLVGLNEMLGLDLPARELMAIGATLGADVPFFVFREPAVATGIGDVLEPLPLELPPVWYVLVNPGVAVSTAWVYQNLGLTSRNDEYRLPRFPRAVGEFSRFLHNDLERVTVPGYPVVAEIKNFLLANGAVAALMSGSGPTVFGVFADEESAKAAGEKVGRERDWSVFVVHPVSHDEE